MKRLTKTATLDVATLAKQIVDYIGKDKLKSLAEQDSEAYAERFGDEVCDDYSEYMDDDYDCDDVINEYYEYMCSNDFDGDSSLLLEEVYTVAEEQYNYDYSNVEELEAELAKLLGSKTIGDYITDNLSSKGYRILERAQRDLEDIAVDMKADTEYRRRGWTSSDDRW